MLDQAQLQALLALSSDPQLCGQGLEFTNIEGPGVQKQGFGEIRVKWWASIAQELGEDGELSEERTEPIAADAREGKDGKRNALLKLVAGLLGVGFDELKQRDAVRRQRRIMLVAGVSVVLMLVMGGLAIWAMSQKKEADKQRTEAENQREIAETKQNEAVVP